MNKEILLIGGLLIGAVVFIVWFLNKKLSSLTDKRPDDTLVQWLKTMQSTLDNTSTTLNSALSSSNKNLTDTLQKNNEELNRRLDGAARLMGEIQKKAGEFAEVSQSMRSLQDYLRSPKLRGNIGEEVLKDLIAQMFPKNSFFLQYSFKSGVKVDAAIKTDGGILPIDSKFPSENFQKMMVAQNDAEKEIARKDLVRDVKKHIDAISEKYILPEEGTMDFALMYIPSEPIYYEVVNDLTLTDYARQHRVYPVSPNTLYANLQVIMLSFQGKDIEKKSHQLFALIRGAQKDFQKVTDSLSTLNRHVTNSYNQMNNVQSEFNLLGQKLTSANMLDNGSEIENTQKLSPS